MTNLSPNAQKALDAFIKGYICNSYGQAYRSGLAAAIRELADQLINVKWSVEMQDLHHEFHVIATELEGTNGPA